jgi:acid-sensing ion channel, other
MSISENLLTILQDYCLHSSLVGLGYIANKKYHFTERLFWLFCFLASVSGSYYLISNIIATSQTDVMSINTEPANPHDVTNFPSMGVCEMGITGEVDSRLIDIIEGLKPHEDISYDFNVEEFLLQVIYHNMRSHHDKWITYYCNQQCDDCIKCPLDNYLEYADKVSYSSNNYILWTNHFDH